jgi:hypothetical protein
LRRAPHCQRSAVNLDTTGSCGSIFRSRSGEQEDFTSSHFEHLELNNAQIN